MTFFGLTFMRELITFFLLQIASVDYSVFVGVEFIFHFMHISSSVIQSQNNLDLEHFLIFKLHIDLFSGGHHLFYI